MKISLMKKIIIATTLLILLPSCAGLEKYAQLSQQDAPYDRHAWSGYADRARAETYCENSIYNKSVNPAGMKQAVQDDPESRRIFVGLKLDCMTRLGWL